MFFFNHCCNNECNRCVKCCRPVERDEFRCSCMCYRKQNGCGGGCGCGDKYCD